MRFQFDQLQTTLQKGPFTVEQLQFLVQAICQFYSNNVDGGRLVSIQCLYNCEMSVKLQNICVFLLRLFCF